MTALEYDYTTMPFAWSRGNVQHILTVLFHARYNINCIYDAHDQHDCVLTNKYTKFIALHLFYIVMKKVYFLLNSAYIPVLFSVSGSALLQGV